MNILRLLGVLLVLTLTTLPVHALPYGNTWGSYPYYPTSYIGPARTGPISYGTVYPNPWHTPNWQWFGQYRAYTHQAYASPYQMTYAVPYLGPTSSRYYTYRSP